MSDIKDERNSEVSFDPLNQERHFDANGRAGSKFGKRHIQILLLTALLTVSFAVRAMMSVAVVAMTSSEASSNKDIPTYNWTDKNLILSAFLWGYFVPQIGAGYLADHFGAKWFLTCSSFTGFFAGLFIPICANHFGSKAVVVLRIIQGLCQAFLYPSMSSSMGKWIPSNERSLYGAFIYSGTPIGAMVSMLLSGYISSSSYGWPYVFYVFNGFGIFVILIYSYFGYSSPDKHTTISEEEKYYILSNLEVDFDRKHMKLPLKEICLSMPFYSLFVVHICYNFTFWLFLTETPIYLNKVLDFNIKSNGLLSSLPYGVEILSTFVACYLSNILLSRNIMRVTSIRKLMNNIGMIVPAIALSLLANSVSASLTVISIVSVTGFHGTSRSGYLLNYMDLSPNFSGVLMGITNEIGILVSAATPLVVQYIVQNEKDRGQWRIVFYIALSVNIFAIIFNTLFTSGEVQPWNKLKKVKEKGKAEDDLQKYELVSPHEGNDEATQL